MPTLDGKPLVSEVVSRRGKRCRIVVTLEAEVSDEALKSLPNYKRTAQDYVKENFDPEPLWESLVDVLGEGIEVSDLKMEALS